MQNIKMAEHNRPYLNVKLEGYYHDDEMFAKIRYVSGSQVGWQQIILNRASLEALDLRPLDTFKWRPREDGRVYQEDIMEHPRRADPGETERTAQAFEELEKMMEKLRV